MKVVYKYRLQETDSQEIEMPEGAQILSVQIQYHDACIWAMVDPVRPMKKRKFLMYGTGVNIEQEAYGQKFLNKLSYVATCVLHGGRLVVHIFEQLS